MGPALTPLRIALVVVVAVGFVAAGGAVILSDESPRPSPEAVDNASERYRSLDGFAATMEQTIHLGNDTTRTVRRVTTVPGTGKYRTVALNDTAGYDVSVSNGTTMWYYDRENETVRRLSLDIENNQGGVLVAGATIEGIMEAAFAESNETASGVSTLPMVSSPGASVASGSLPANDSSLDLDVSYLGTERVGDHDTYVFELTQPAGTTTLENYTARMWVDTEWFVPLRQSTSFTVDGERYETTARYRNVSFDPDLSNASFRFDPPADANVTVETGPSLTRYDSRAALARNATLSLPDPELPGNFSFQDGLHTVGQRRSVTLQYSNGTASFSVTVNGRTANTTAQGRAVQIGSATGSLQTLAETTLLSWQCDGQTYSVIATPVGNETVIDVARSIGCEQEPAEARSGTVTVEPGTSGERESVSAATRG